MKIIIGLGNIGSDYKNNRHNTGFLALDKLANELNTEGLEITWHNDSKLKALISKFKYHENDISLVKPTTLMNLSGQAVINVLSFYKENPENIIIVYDDIDLPLGKIRFRPEGSAGTHNGMKSIIEALGTEKFPRLRIGIESRGSHAPLHQELSSFVLSDFQEAEKNDLSKAMEESTKILKDFIS